MVWPRNLENRSGYSTQFVCYNFVVIYVAGFLSRAAGNNSEGSYQI